MQNEARISQNPLRALGSYDETDKIGEKMKAEELAKEEDEELPDYLTIKEIFSFENVARMHREIEQLKDVVREMRGQQIPKL